MGLLRHGRERWQKKFQAPPPVAEPAPVDPNQGVARCTYCGGTQFFDGPSAGMATNVLCANPECRHWFNSSPFGMDDLHRIEPTDAEKVAAAAAKKNAADEQRQKTWTRGYSLFVRGQNAAACISGEDGDLLRLAGWMDAQRDELLARGVLDLEPVINSKGE